MTTAESPTSNPKAMPSSGRRFSRYALSAILIVFLGMGGGWVRGKFQEHEIERFTRDYEQRGGRVMHSDVSPLEDLASMVGVRIPHTLKFNYCSVGAGSDKSGVQEFIGDWLISKTEFEVVVLLNGAAVMESDTAAFSKMKYLEMLSLPKTKLSRGLIRSLSCLKRLDSLDLPDSLATDETLAEACRALQHHPNFISLTLGKTHVTENGIKELRRLKNLIDAEIESPYLKDVKASFLATRKQSR